MRVAKSGVLEWRSVEILVASEQAVRLGECSSFQREREGSSGARGFSCRYWERRTEARVWRTAGSEGEVRRAEETCVSQMASASGCQERSVM